MKGRKNAVSGSLYDHAIALGHGFLEYPVVHPLERVGDLLTQSAASRGRSDPICREDRDQVGRGHPRPLYQTNCSGRSSLTGTTTSAGSPARRAASRMASASAAS